MLSKNKDSCVLDSFASVVKMDPRHLMEAIGHDGMGTGFHVQELIGPLLDLGYAVTPIELEPRAKDESGREWSIQFTGGHFRRFIKYLGCGVGVLTGFNQNYRPHAVVLGGSYYIIDPATGKSYELFQYEGGKPMGFTPHFTPVCFWKVDRLQG